jgi:MFS family permease
MTERRWLRIIPVMLVMYTISYVDRTNVSLALDPTISSMMRDLMMDDRAKGQAAGIFFLGYVLLQIPGGHWAHRWSARKIVSVLLVSWGICAVGCGLSRTLTEFQITRFMLGVAESGVFPATLVLTANWFPRAERARANAYWILCQPMAVAVSAPITSWLLGTYGWQRMLILEGALPFVWLPVWWFCVTDHPREAKWISAEEREYLEKTLSREAAESETGVSNSPDWSFRARLLGLLMIIYFLQNSAAYGCMTFFTESLKGKGFTAFEYGLLFAVPYALSLVIMVLNSWHSDKKQERAGHVAIAYGMTGACLVLAVMLKGHFWPAYFFLCLAIPGPFAGMGPFWAIPAETLPRSLMGPMMGLINAIGNLGGFAGPFVMGWLKQEYGSISVSFNTVGIGMLVAAALCLLLPRRKLCQAPVGSPGQVGAHR